MNKNNFFKTSNRRAFALVLAAALVLAVLSGCSGSGQKASSEDAIAKYGSDTMKLYIPGEYLGQNVISNFEKQFGVNVIVEYFDSNEMMYTKLQAGDAYDVLVPSDYMIERLIKSDMLQPLDPEKIPNKELLAEEVKNLPFDPNNTYA
ncbi:MAG: extracellular solute-binding protein, partial [Oscillospiraceae bacterium]|nr:extracellular solute-binding protein [Oscillospiraceae bacterium]